MTKGEVGRRVGKSRVAVSNLIRLLELPDEVLELIESGSPQRGPRPRDPDGEGPRRAQAPRARGARDGGWSVRETERRAKGAGGRRERGGDGPIELHPDLADALAAAEDALQAALGVEVRVKAHGAPAAGSRSTSTRPRDGVDLAERILRREPPAQARAA